MFDVDRSSAAARSLPKTRVWASRISVPNGVWSESSLTRSSHQSWSERCTTIASERGKYMQVDPIGVGGSGLFDLRRGHLRMYSASNAHKRPVLSKAGMSPDMLINPFRYVEANPLRFSDPLGLVKFLCEVHADSRYPLIKVDPNGQPTGLCIYNGECEGPGDLIAIAVGLQLESKPPCEECYDVCWYVWDSDTDTRQNVKCIYKWWKHLWPFDQHHH